MSPEQARGNRTVDFRADLWSMGVIAYECLTGRLPFASSALGDLVVKICTQATPRPSDLAEVPPGFDEWFARSCEKTPEERFQSMREQNEALQALLGTSVAPVSPNRSTPRARRVTPDQSPLSRDLSIDFGDFHTLESVAPPAGATPDLRRRVDPGTDAAALAAGKRASSAAPVEVAAAARKPRSRWLPVLALGVIGIGFALLVNRAKTQRASSLPPIAPNGPVQNAAIGVSPAAEETPNVTTRPPPAVTQNSQDTLRIAPDAPNPATSNTAPMDMTSVTVKLPRKAGGAAKSAELATEPTSSRSAVSSPTDVNATDVTTDRGAKAPDQAPHVPPVTATSDTFRGRELFDDRE
jgi:serine/threonine-protein kinase